LISRVRASLLDHQENRLWTLSGLILVFLAAGLTLSPAVRARSWDVDYKWAHWVGLILWAVLFYFANRISTRQLPHHDPYLLPIASLLTGWGLMTIWRLTPTFGLRQTLWMIPAILLLIWGVNQPSLLVSLKRYKYIWLTGGLILTGFTLLFGTNPTGSAFPHLWLGCCGFYIQPSEPLKLLLIIYLAAYLADSQDERAKRRDGKLIVTTQISHRLLPFLAPTVIMTGLALLLLVFQRDLGTATIFLFLFAVTIYVATDRWEIPAATGVLLTMAGIGGYFLFDVVRLRIDAWINPWLDPSGRSYQIVQSIMAVANGGLLGRGAGMGNPGLVPIPHSDFIFAAISEETGLVGSLALIILLVLFCTRGLSIALRTSDYFQRFLACGLTAYISAQAILIIGGNLRLLPLTGVTLPFVSYGGSSLVTSFLALMILLQISHQSPDPLLDQPNLKPILHLGGFLYTGFFAAAITTGWWAYYRGPSLLTRTDNPRRAIADLSVRRGDILDRNNDPLVTTQGEPGSYSRQILYPALSPVIGYNDPKYGQSGLESSLDEYLRGLEGYPGMTIWWNHLVYGQPPPGLNVRLTLETRLQKIADQLLAEKTGALVLINAQTGDVLVMASHPGFDANQLNTNWNELITDSSSPLLNRAALGLYPTGELDNLLNPKNYTTENFYNVPQLRLPSDQMAASKTGEAITPVQMAVMAATLSHNGTRPAVSLVTAVETPLAGWVILTPLEKENPVISVTSVQTMIDKYAESTQETWSITSVIDKNTDRPITWFVGGTLPTHQDTSFALALVLEESNPELANQIGAELLSSALHP
jgi:cell division protein FtsW (lipid II flippase)